jgi:hypothetical protein
VSAESPLESTDTGSRGTAPVVPSGTDNEIAGIRVCRPSLFIRPDVSGLIEATTVLSGDRLVGRWLLCLQWTDGDRHVVPLTEWLDDPLGGRLWLAPYPAAPPVGSTPAWSQAGRARWLAGDSPLFPDVFSALCGCISRFVIFPEEHAAEALETVSLWVLLTYCYPAWPAVPYLHISGTLASGKTRLLDILSHLVRRPIVASSMTASLLFRTLHEQGGTLLLDEAETLGQQSASSELRTVLLAGYRASGRVARLRRDRSGFRPVYFEVFGPKALGGIGDVPPALASRCIRLTMLRTEGNLSQVRARLDSAAETWQTLRDDLHALALSRGAEVLQAANAADDPADGMSGRDAELWRPLLTLARLCDPDGNAGLTERLRRYAEHVVVDGLDDAAPEQDRILFGLLATSVTGLQGDVTPKELLERAQRDAPTLFARWTPHRVATTLRRYGLCTRKTSGGRRSFRDITPTQLLRLSQLYGFAHS